MFDRIKNNEFPYETDGVIYTPSNLGVGCTKEGERHTYIKKTWGHAFKWKPVEFLTIDFLVTVKKNSSNGELVQTKFSNNTYSKDSAIHYKTLELRVGYDEQKDGYLNPYDMVLNDNIPSIDYSSDNTNAYKPTLFYPDTPINKMAHICNIEVKLDENNMYQMFSEEGDKIEDNTIVECRYNQNRDAGWRWEVLRVRYDKTESYRSGEPQYGNAFHTANANWRMIHNPITPVMIETGKNIPKYLDELADNVYYTNKNKQTNISNMRDFHNRFVKTILISKISRPGDVLIDFGVGQGGDLYKWINAKLSFVFGMDYHSDGIKNRNQGACKRFIDYKKKCIRNKQSLDCIFVPGDCGSNIKNGDSVYDNESRKILECLFGIKKNEGFVGNGVLRQYGKLINGADIGSMQFALHYMIESKEKLMRFMKNLTECIKIGGYFVGTCFDGKLIFDLLKNHKMGESFTLGKPDDITWQITKQYSDQILTYPNDDTSIGLEVDVYQDTIGKTFREYLVNFDYLIQVMYDFGFEPVSQNTLDDMRFPSAIDNFQTLYKMMNNILMHNPHMKKEYKNAMNLTEDEMTISFLNSFFIFKRVREVNVSQQIAMKTLTDREILNQQIRTTPSVSDILKENTQSKETPQQPELQQPEKKGKGKKRLILKKK